jgi:hypothetical protein
MRCVIAAVALAAGACGSGTSSDVDAAPLPDVAPGLCNTDADCTSGAEWCVGGACVPCDNSGLVCDIFCANGWMTYERNGCFPCECAPTNECASDGDCGMGATCYAGAFCWDWCPPGDPTCCYGNFCSASGCSWPPPTGCVTRGCPAGRSCDPTAGCAASTCDCGATGWSCTEDCGGGTCT